MTAHAVTAAAAIELIHHLCMEWDTTLDNKQLLLITAYTESSDPWTLETARVHSSEILTRQLRGIPDSDAVFLLGTVLQDHLKPIFAHFVPKYTTPSGRPAHYAAENRTSISTASEETRGWTEKLAYAATTLVWAVNHAEVGISHFLLGLGRF